MLSAAQLAAGMLICCAACDNSEKGRQVSMLEYTGKIGPAANNYEILCNMLNEMRQREGPLNMWFNQHIADGTIQVSETIDFVPPPVKVLEFPGVQGMKVIVNENDELAFHADRVMETKRWEGYHVWHRIQDALRALMRKANIEWKGQAEGDTDLVCTDQGTMIRMSDVGMSEGDER